jgi:hypothetical protein
MKRLRRTEGRPHLEAGLNTAHLFLQVIIVIRVTCYRTKGSSYKNNLTEKVCKDREQVKYERFWGGD